MALGMGLLVHRTTEDRSMGVGRAAALEELAAAEREFRGEEPAMRPQSPIRESPTRESPSLQPPSSEPPSREPAYLTGQELPEELLELLGSGDGPVTWYDTRRPAQGPFMWAAARVDGTPVAVRNSMLGDFFARQALDRHMRYAALATLAVVVPLTLLGAELVLRRLRRVAGTARAIRGGDLEARTGGRGHDEISEISAAVDHMADALRDRLRSEQRFTADVAHELRTPLTALVSAASVLPESEATDLVRDRVRVLRGLVDDLLEISRLDAGAERSETRPVPLGDLVEDCVRRAGVEGVRVTVVGRPVADTDPRRLDRILTNLLVNAQRHGRPPVEVTVEEEAGGAGKPAGADTAAGAGAGAGGGTGARIRVRDHGPGYPAELLAAGPQRFRTGAAERGHGHGLGLTIALGQARVIGARLTFGEAEPDGSRGRDASRSPEEVGGPQGAEGAEGGQCPGRARGAVATLELPPPPPPTAGP
ncbi:HAMP domain-containing sensor histidine kinase [Streptomyces sp. NPDC097619]|uniref:sensor histidine kinase n=1 Tax=Streptomyces sp. NPDC097619 TaxID=3157228 RepID=UPI00332AF932